MGGRCLLEVSMLSARYCAIFVGAKIACMGVVIGCPMHLHCLLYESFRVFKHSGKSPGINPALRASFSIYMVRWSLEKGTVICAEDLYLSFITPHDHFRVIVSISVNSRGFIYKILFGLLLLRGCAFVAAFLTAATR